VSSKNVDEAMAEMASFLSNRKKKVENVERDADMGSGDEEAYAPAKNAEDESGLKARLARRLSSRPASGVNRKKKFRVSLKATHLSRSFSSCHCFSSFITHSKTDLDNRSAREPSQQRKLLPSIHLGPRRATNHPQSCCIIS
jgi:hypothetical protein